MKRLISLVAALSLAVSAFAQSTVDSLHIDVNLQYNGNAVITEVWDIDVSSDISEWYLVRYNLRNNGMDIKSLRVSDETGLEYVTEQGEWVIERSRAQKAGRCGLLSKDRGYEVCWGVGSSGHHVYKVMYELTGLVKSYSDMDGFNHMFAPAGQESAPGYIELRIHSRDTTFSYDNSRIWAFGYAGDFNFEDGCMVARTSSPFTYKSRMILMAGFEKGVLSPVYEGNGTFEDVKDKALKGSEYNDKGDRLFNSLFALLTALVVGLFGFIGISSAVKSSKRRKLLFGGKKKDVAWFRDIAVDGDLHKAAAVLNVMEPTSDTLGNLIPAYITRLVYKKAFSIVPDGKGNNLLKVGEYELPSEATEDERLEHELFGFIKEAAGADGLIQKREIRRWASSNSKTLHEWQESTATNDTIWSLTPEQVQQVFGLRKFLKDFTLIEDRGVVEVHLWNYYLIFASLFGIADQVRKDFKKVCPEYFTLSETAAAMADTSTASVWNTIHYVSTNMNSYGNAYAAGKNYIPGSSWSTGGGGGASWGGGGGFSGGGFGGGGR